MNTVLLLGGDMIHPDLPNSFLNLLSEGFESAEEDRKLKLFAVHSYISLLQGEPEKLPQRLLQVISWVLGEYCHLKEDLEPATVLKLMANLLDLKNTSSETKTWVLLAMTKLCESSSTKVSVIREVCEAYCSSPDTVLRQRAQELQHLSQDSDLRARVLPHDASRKPLEVDSSLSFLDEFVSEALAAGAAPYKPPHQRQEELADGKALNLEPYALSLPISMSSCSVTDRQSPTLLSMSSGLSGNSTDRSHKGGSTSLNLDGVKRVWGKDGYLVKRVPVEGAGQVEVPDLPQSPSPEPKAAVSHSQTGTSHGGAELEPEKQQLASSLFVGLASHSSVSLMGKTEENPHRFRRRAKASDASQEGMSSAAFSSSTSVDNFLCETLLDPETTTSPQLPLNLSTTNGTCDVELTENKLEGENSSPAVDNNVDQGTESAHREEQQTPKDFCLGSHFPAALRGLPCSEITPLSSSQSLDLSACHVQKEDALILLLFIHNSSSSDIQQMRFELRSDDLEVSPCAGVMQEVRSATVAVCQSSLSVKRPSVHVEVGGVVSCTLPVGTPLSLNFSYKLPLTSFIRPLAISTEEYGKMWLHFSHDTKQNLKAMGGGLADTLNVLTNKLQLHVVEIIGVEGIVACQLLQNQPCLLHCRLHAGALALWLRSPVPELPDCLIYHCQRALNEL